MIAAPLRVVDPSAWIEWLIGSALGKKLGESREELFKLRFQHATAQLEKTHRLREVRKDIARIHELSDIHDRFLIDAGILVGAFKFAENVFIDGLASEKFIILA